MAKNTIRQSKTREKIITPEKVDEETFLQGAAVSDASDRNERQIVEIRHPGGRPPIFDERRKLKAFNLPLSLIERIKKDAKRQHKSDTDIAIEAFESFYDVEFSRKIREND